MCGGEELGDSGDKAQKEGLFGVEEEGDRHEEGGVMMEGVNKSDIVRKVHGQSAMKPDTLCPDF